MKELVLTSGSRCLANLDKVLFQDVVLYGESDSGIAVSVRVHNRKEHCIGARSTNPELMMRLDLRNLPSLI
jgi:hypothetical protein